MIICSVTFSAWTHVYGEWSAFDITYRIILSAAVCEWHVCDWRLGSIVMSPLRCQWWSRLHRFKHGVLYIVYHHLYTRATLVHYDSVNRLTMTLARKWRSFVRNFREPRLLAAGRLVKWRAQCTICHAFLTIVEMKAKVQYLCKKLQLYVEISKVHVDVTDVAISTCTCACTCILCLYTSFNN